MNSFPSSCPFAQSEALVVGPASKASWRTSELDELCRPLPSLRFSKIKALNTSKGYLSLTFWQLSMTWEFSSLYLLEEENASLEMITSKKSCLVYNIFLISLFCRGSCDYCNLLHLYIVLSVTYYLGVSFHNNSSIPIVFVFWDSQWQVREERSEVLKAPRAKNYKRWNILPSWSLWDFCIVSYPVYCNSKFVVVRPPTWMTRWPSCFLLPWLIMKEWLLPSYTQGKFESHHLIFTMWTLQGSLWAVWQLESKISDRTW